MKLSLCVPYHHTRKTAFFLARLLTSIREQTYKDYEIILTSDGLMAKNHNSAIKKATGDIIQFIGMDDRFTSPHSLKEIVEAYEDPKVIWQITGSRHEEEGVTLEDHTPYWTNNLLQGNNKLGGLSTLSFRRDKALFFDEKLSWMIDVDLYYRLAKEYGQPHINTKQSVTVDVGRHRTSATLPDEQKLEEARYIQKKYAK